MTDIESPAPTSGGAAIVTNATLQRFRPDQMQILKGHYEVNPRPTSDEMRTIAAEIQESERKVKTWFSNWRSKNTKQGNPPPPLPHQLANQLHNSSPAPEAAAASRAATPVAHVVDSVMARPPPKRVAALSHATPHASPIPDAVAPAPLLTSYPPPPAPIHASQLPPFAVASISRLMRSSYYTPHTVEEYEIRRRRKLDDEAANNALAAQKKQMNQKPPSSIASSSTHQHKPSQSQQQIPHHTASSAASSSTPKPIIKVSKPKSTKELARAAKMITETLKKLKKANHGQINPEAVLLMQQAKNLGLIPQSASLDDEAMGEDADSSSSSSSGSDSDSETDTDSESGSDSGSGSSSSGSSSGSDDREPMQF
ncbi:hypothetical protein HDU98_011431 [Podochytrium sp. JEL0797]|nr:hypothetical protein HDU98_011431 [Podochytrium sp. JEL0797]